MRIAFSCKSSLTALGIAIGIAMLVAVVGISASSRADVLAQLDALGTDLLSVAPGRPRSASQRHFPSRPATRLPPSARSPMPLASRQSKRRSAATTSSTSPSPAASLAAADPSVLEVVSAELADGRFLDARVSRPPTVVLGADAARRLGIDHVGDGVRVWLGGQWFAVIGIMEPAPLAPDLDAAALIGYEVADELFETTRSPSTLYVRTVPDQVEQVRDVLARSVDPESPNEVDVSRPSMPWPPARRPTPRCATCWSGSVPSPSSLAASGSRTCS